MTKLIASRAEKIAGTTRVPGDKSISHRALMLGALAVGRSHVTGLLEGEDVLHTAAAMRAMGAELNRIGPGEWEIYGVGVGGLRAPAHALDMGNAGTAARLLMGLVASHDITATFVGDASLSKRPMGRVIEPLRQIGATFLCHGDKLPLTMRGTGQALTVAYKSPVASAQVKSAILLAALNTAGTSSVWEPVQTRDHSERMLRAMGADIAAGAEDGGWRVALTGFAELTPLNITIPGDISSAAFPITAAAMLPGSQLVVENVGLNPLRTGLLDALEAMGASLAIHNRREISGEPVGDIHVEGGPLRAIDDIGGHPSTMIDEFPALFAAAAVAEGTSVFRGLGELRVKESDRLHAMFKALTAAGATVEELDDGLAITGQPAGLTGGGHIDSQLDHRIAMASCILGSRCAAPLTIAGAEAVGTSFPDFAALMRGLGMDVKETDQ